MNVLQQIAGWLRNRPNSYKDTSINLDKPITAWNDAFTGIKKLLFHLLVLVSISGNLFDLFFTDHYMVNYVQYINYMYIIMVIGFFILSKTKSLKLHVASNIVIYTLVLNILFSLNIAHPHFSEFFLRETIFLGIIVVIAGIINPNNTIIIGIVYFLYYIISMLSTQNAFLLDNSGLMLFIILGYVVILNYVYTSFQQSFLLQQKLTFELNESNKLLDRQKKIIEESETKYRMLADNAGDFIAMYDSKGNFTYTSPAVKKLLGFEPGDLLQKSALDLVHTDDIKEVKRCIARTIPGTKTVTSQYRAQKLDGDFIWVEAIMQKINSLNNRYLAIIRDISQRKKVQEQLELANQTKDKFFSIIAHDLKSPMAQIFSSSNLLNEKYQTLNEEDKFILIDALCQGSEKLSSLLDDLLLWSRSQMGKIEIVPEICNMQDLLMDCLNLFRQVLEAKNINVVVLNKNPQFIYADINSVKTVLRNILSNAIKFSHANSVIKLGLQATGSFTEIKIEDNGIGISVERISSLFQIDKSISTPGTQNESGTGLGIIICKELIEKNKGQLSVQSEVDKGTTFKILLPKEKFIP